MGYTTDQGARASSFGFGDETEAQQQVASLLGPTFPRGLSSLSGDAAEDICCCTHRRAHTPNIPSDFSLLRRLGKGFLMPSKSGLKKRPSDKGLASCCCLQAATGSVKGKCSVKMNFLPTRKGTLIQSERCRLLLH